MMKMREFLTGKKAWVANAIFLAEIGLEADDPSQINIHLGNGKPIPIYFDDGWELRYQLAELIEILDSYIASLSIDTNQFDHHGLLSHYLYNSTGDTAGILFVLFKSENMDNVKLSIVSLHDDIVTSVEASALDHSRFNCRRVTRDMIRLMKKLRSLMIRLRDSSCPRSVQKPETEMREVNGEA